MATDAVALQQKAEILRLTPSAFRRDVY